MALGLAELAQRGFAALNSGNPEALFALVSDDVVAIVPGEFANEGVYEGRDGFRLMFAHWMEAWDTFHVEPLEFTEVDGGVVVAVRQVARGRGSGIDLETDLAYLLRARDGLLTEWRLCHDVDEALALVGSEPE
ncbi:MAG: nuclear transport factor 2 family protein [Thermoleophilaceae bacterium]|nr:nuclear transport factor 2 family protein [Thermoleophilaceae bacterium]